MYQNLVEYRLTHGNTWKVTYISITLEMHQNVYIVWLGYASIIIKNMLLLNVGNLKTLVYAFFFVVTLCS